MDHAKNQDLSILSPIEDQVLGESCNRHPANAAEFVLTKPASRTEENFPQG